MKTTILEQKRIQKVFKFVIIQVVVSAPMMQAVIKAAVAEEKLETIVTKLVAI